MSTSLGLILAILPIHFTVMASPGPNSVVLLTTSLSHGRSDAMRVALGISVATLVWMVGAVVGVSVILEALPALGQALKIAGGGYLIYLSFKLWTANGLNPDSLEKADKSQRSYFRCGLIANLTNPKPRLISAAYLRLLLPPKCLRLR